MLQFGSEKGVIRICCVCHRILDGKEALSQIEACTKKGKGVEFTHGFCPECFQSEMEKIIDSNCGYPVDSVDQN